MGTPISAFSSRCRLSMLSSSARAFCPEYGLPCFFLSFGRRGSRCCLAKPGVSDNVGGVKHVATTLPHALEQERHFALIGEVLNPTKARFLISIQVGKLSSTHASLRSQARS